MSEGGPGKTLGSLFLSFRGCKAMAEIKSTLELALERSKRFTLSEKEKEEIKQKEIQEKILSLFHRYGEGRLSLNDLQREIDRMEERVRKPVKEELLKRWLEALSLSGENERSLRGIEWLKQQPIDEVKAHLQNLTEQYQREKDRIREEVRTQLSEALRKEGFGGDAIEPNVEMSKGWEKALSAVNQEYQLKLERIKERLTLL